MYIEHTPQGYNIMGMSSELLEEIVFALRETYPLEDCPTVCQLVAEAEKELKSLKK